MTLTSWLIRNRDPVADTWLARDRFARAYADHPHAPHFRAHAAKARRRPARWDRALRLWIRGGTRR